MDALHGVTHDHEQTRPIVLGELPERGHYPCMNPLLVGLSESYH